MLTETYLTHGGDKSISVRASAKYLLLLCVSAGRVTLIMLRANPSDPSRPLAPRTLTPADQHL